MNLPSAPVIKKIATGTALGIGIGELLIPAIHHIAARSNHRLANIIQDYTPDHTKEMGVSAVAGGMFSQSPTMASTGIGMIISDVRQRVGSEGRTMREANRALEGQKEWGMDFHRYNIPDHLPSTVKYRMMAKILRRIVVKDTYNRVRRVNVPAGREHPAVLAKAREIVRMNRLDGHDKKAVALAYQRWMQNRDYMSYIYDSRFLDEFIHPYLTLIMEGGDCDDQALLMASMLEATGIQARMKLIAQHPERPNHFSHIYTVAVIDGKELPLETIFKVPPGWEAKHHKAMTIHLD